MANNKKNEITENIEITQDGETTEVIEVTDDGDDSELTEFENADDNSVVAKRTYETFLAMLDAQEWVYHRDDDNLAFHLTTQSDGLPMMLRVTVDKDCCLVLLFSTLDFKIPAKYINEGALAICMINDSLIDGSFDFNVKTGEICYRMAMPFRESIISMKACEFYIFWAFHFIDRYAAKLLLLSQGMINAEQLYKIIHEDD